MPTARRVQPAPPRPRPVYTGDARARAVSWLQAHSSPRLLMSLMLASTIGCGFLTSFLLLHVGVHSPLARYPMAVIAAWIMFLLLVSVWVWWQRRAHRQYLASRNEFANRRKSGQNFDLPSGGSGGSGSGWSGGGGGGGRSAGDFSGGGGRFGGAGASDSYADVSAQGFANGLTSSSSSSSSSGSAGGGGWDLDFGGDDLGAVVLLIVVAVVALAVLGLAGYVVYSAPTFFAELLIDGGVGTWLYKRAGVASNADWLSTAMRRSVLPMLVVLALFTALAFTMQQVAPGSATLVQAWGAVTAPKVTPP